MKTIHGGDQPPLHVVADAEIIALDDFRGGAEPKFRILRSPSCWCTLVFSEKERSVTCARCGKIYEPFEALIYVVKFWPRYAQNRDALKDECESLTKKREALRVEVKNLTAQRKRLEDKP